jgi:hypothetical protein
VYSGFLKRVDRFRRWARGCPCHEEQRLNGVAVICDRVGRRLRDAPDQLKDLVMWFSETVRSLTLADCEGDQDLYLQYSGSLRLALVDISERFGWVEKPPYIFCNITVVAWACVWVDHIESAPESDRHRVTNFLEAKFGPAIRQIASGAQAPPTQAIMDESDIWGDMSLVSDKSEGFHRTIRQEHTRCPAAKVPWLFASMRLTQNLVLCNHFCETAQGKELFKTNYVNFSRVLQIKTRCFAKRVRSGTRRYKLTQLYRLDEFSRVDFGLTRHECCNGRD